MLAHYAVRRLIHEAADKAGEDPDRISFVHAVRVMRRRIVNPGAFPLYLSCRPLGSPFGESKPVHARRRPSTPERGSGGVEGREHSWTP